MERTHTFSVTGEDAKKRLDVFLCERLSGEPGTREITRSMIKNMVDSGLVAVGGGPAKAGRKLKAGEVVQVTVPEPEPIRVEPEEIPLDILYEDEDIIVVNKPPDLPVHPGAGRSSGTLVNALAAHTRELSSVGGGLRPGVVHRLDKDTTGSLVIAKNDPSHRALAAQFKEHSTARKYVALVWGMVAEDEGEITLPLGRDPRHRKKISTRARKKRRASTVFRVARRYGPVTLVELFPKTGRTHQLRVHLSAVGHPIVGDPLYGRKKSPQGLSKRLTDGLKKMKRQCLHAEVLGFIHPGKGTYVEFSAPLPPDMAALIDLLEEECS